VIGAIITLWWMARTALYWYALRFRKITATLMTCLIIAGLPIALLVMFIFILPPILPEGILIPASIGLSIYLLMHYTKVALLPDGLLIPICVEAISYVLLWGVWKLL